MGNLLVKIIYVHTMYDYVAIVIKFLLIMRRQHLIIIRLLRLAYIVEQEYFAFLIELFNID